jgi:hypothetical protein
LDSGDDEITIEYKQLMNSKMEIDRELEGKKARFKELFVRYRKPNKGYAPYKDAVDDGDNLEYQRIFEKIDGLELGECVDAFVGNPMGYGEDDQ